ncbi:MAG: hypothetical protein P9L98_02445 [Candidatus Kaelpia imicola]|nr:hypothetical protein [Candidatus Kaelpia imicola]
MVWEEDFDRELKKLKEALNKILIKSKEFQSFRKKLKEWNLDSDILFQMHIVDKDDSGSFKKGKIERRNKTSIAREDIAFFKRNGIKWD